jgi:hypothetical protein
METRRTSIFAGVSANKEREVHLGAMYLSAQ